MEDVFGAGLQMLVPDLNESIRFMRSRWILGVRCKNQFRELLIDQYTLVFKVRRYWMMPTFCEKLMSVTIRFLLQRSS